MSVNPQIISSIQIVTGVLLSVLILLQAKGTGLGSTFGGEAGFYRTKRGAERLMFIMTIVISVIFISSAIAGLIL